MNYREIEKNDATEEIQLWCLLWHVLHVCKCVRGGNSDWEEFVTGKILLGKMWT